MSNSPLVTYTKWSPFKTTPRSHAIDHVVIHCYVGQKTAKQMADYFATAGADCAPHYSVGKDGSFSQSVDERDRAWTTGGKDPKTGKPIYVNGISGAIMDHRAVTIEVACDPKHPYAITDAAMESLITLLVDICKRNPGIGKLRWKGDKSLVGKPEEQNMAAHRWFANKECPGDYLYNRFGEIAAEVNRRLEEEKDLTKAETLELIKDTLSGIHTEPVYKTLQDVPEYYQPTIRKLIESGALQGSDIGDPDDPEDNIINVTEVYCRVMTTLDRRGVLDK